ncbi:MAG: 50S ribosomal protein L3 [bacterium]
MEKFIIGKKVDMSQAFEENGNVVPLTIIQAGPCKILQVKSKEKDGYEAFQFGFDEQLPRKVKKPMKGKEFKHLKEFRPRKSLKEFGEEAKEWKEGDWVNVSIFKEGDKVGVSGIAKGKGFQGAVKKWGFHGKNATHGNRHDERSLGSVGTSGHHRVTKGRRMPGRMGGGRITVRNLKIMKVDPENNVLLIRGAIPGRKGIIVEVRG